ncbi:hypothetical protein NAPIS_ORF01186 [Vairimorpha apis BRL 01]|uniref:Uncharacterized protein n=1 Tax=Vairimorpha apis BRL 01 TaxID=1037528 RepID=T0MJR9_9MICR|nr:hypothetical protein NAPIS_ORF01186 [Vairimorpha apis BRL 01]
MNKQSIGILYGIQIFSIFILDLIATHIISKYKITNRVEYNVFIGDINLMLNTKILLIIDIYFFSYFYLENNLNAIFQNIFVKLTSISIWIILACRFRFATTIIIYISFKIISIIFLLRSLSLMEGLIYVKFNKKIGVDAKMIFKYLLIEMIVTLKYISLIFEYTTMLVSLSLEKGISQKPFNIVKLILLVIDIFIRKQNITTTKYLLITTPFFFSFYIWYDCYR